MDNKTILEEVEHKNSFLEKIIRRKKEIFFMLVILLISSSLFTIGYVIYRFFFWQPPVETLPFQVNFSNVIR